MNFNSPAHCKDEHLTVNWIVSNSVPDLLYNTFPTYLFYILSMGYDKTKLVVIFVVFPPIDSSTKADMLEARHQQQVKDTGIEETDDVSVIRSLLVVN